MRIARGGGIFVAPSLGLLTALFVVWLYNRTHLNLYLSLLALLLLFASLWFFRDPERHPAEEPSPATAVSPADGAVVEAVEGQGECSLAIYLNILNLHVVRLPLAGELTAMERSEGGRKPAYRDAATRNARLDCVVHTQHGDVRVGLVAGLLARRIVPYLATGYNGGRGERLGLIRFGSRVEVVFPPGYNLYVKVGDRVRAGTSIVAGPGTGSEENGSA